MKKEKSDIKNSNLKENSEGKYDLEGYPKYNDDEDIYVKFQKVTKVNPETISGIKELDEKAAPAKEYSKDFIADDPAGDLDIPGAELDDEQELIGNEDEENNYYSLGGDEHNDLDEDKSEL